MRNLRLIWSVYYVQYMCMCTHKNIFDFFVKSLESQSSMDFLCHALCTNPYGKSQCMQFYFFQIHTLFLEKRGMPSWAVCKVLVWLFLFLFTPWLSVSCSSSKGFFSFFSFANWSQAEKGIAVLFALEYSRRSMTPFCVLCLIHHVCGPM